MFLKGGGGRFTDDTPLLQMTSLTAANQQGLFGGGGGKGHAPPSPFSSLNQFLPQFGVLPLAPPNLGGDPFDPVPQLMRSWGRGRGYIMRGRSYTAAPPPRGTLKAAAPLNGGGGRAGPLFFLDTPTPPPKQPMWFKDSFPGNGGRGGRGRGGAPPPFTPTPKRSDFTEIMKNS